MTEPDPLVGTILAERYRVVAAIGQGGAGTVYRGIQLQLEREVAIKVVRPDVPEKSRAELEARFFREAALAGRLSHPHIVRMIDYGSTLDGRQFVVMELLRGRSLKRAVAGGHLDADEVARLGAELARGLHHAHAHGLVHRDVKASNVFLVEDEEGLEHARLLDFGLVKSVKRELDITQTPTYLGTPLYMSPEQARGEQGLDGRSDLYSLGCLLYRMTCGEMPFRGETPMATAVMHINEPYPPMRERAPDVAVDPRLEAIVRRCMEKRPEDRWADGAALAQALDSFRATRLVPPTSRRDAARRTLLGAVGVLGLLGLLVGGVAVVIAAGAIAWSLGVFGGAEAPVPVVVDVRLGPADDVGDDEIDQGMAAVEPVVEPPPEPLELPPAPDPTAPAAAKPPASEAGPTAAPAPPRPEPEPEPAPAPFEPVVVDDYAFDTLDHIKRAVAFVNRATEAELLAAGVHEKVVPTVIAGRPYNTIQRFGWTRGIGPATVRAVGDHTRP